MNSSFSASSRGKAMRHSAAVHPEYVKIEGYQVAMCTMNEMETYQVGPLEGVITAYQVVV